MPAPFRGQIYETWHAATNHHHVNDDLLSDNRLLPTRHYGKLDVKARVPPTFRLWRSWIFPAQACRKTPSIRKCALDFQLQIIEGPTRFLTLSGAAAVGGTAGLGKVGRASSPATP